MSRRTRREERLRAEQPTVAAQREERKDQEALARSGPSEAVLTRAQRLRRLEGDAPVETPRARRVARPGKPLKR